MTDNRRTIERYMDGFRTGDHEQILSCLTEDVEWWIPGMFRVHGRQAFDDQIENDAFVGRPVIDITRVIEENDVVMAEGTVRARRRDGTWLDLAICDVFELENGRIRRLVSYLMETG